MERQRKGRAIWREPNDGVKTYLDPSPTAPFAGLCEYISEPGVGNYLGVVVWKFVGHGFYKRWLEYAAWYIDTVALKVLLENY